MSYKIEEAYFVNILQLDSLLTGKMNFLTSCEVGSNIGIYFNSGKM